MCVSQPSFQKVYGSEGFKYEAVHERGVFLYVPVG